MKYILQTTLILFLLSYSSCLRKHLTEGRAEFVSLDQVQLGDSSMFIGNVRDVVYPDSISYFTYEVWLEPSNLLVNTDSKGGYKLKTVPGTYNIRCQIKHNGYPELIEEIRDFDIGKNEMAHIDFYIGYIAE